MHMAKEIQKKAGVSGNSVAGKSYQIFTVSEELLAKVVEAVQAGEKQARSSGDIQSFEVFCHGYRQNISLGRIMVVPAKVCNDRKNFPTALLHGALIRIFGWGSEEIADLIEKKIGDSEFDEYSQADFDSLKESIFRDARTGKEASLVVFAPNWMNSREYICFHFTENAEELKNDLRHQVFSAYYNPAVSSAFNALMTNVDTTKVDVTDITPKLSYPFLTENPLKQYPQLDKQAGRKKATVLLNRKTADEIEKQTLEPQELDVFDSLNQALENSLLPAADGAQGEGGFTAPESHPGVPREASAKYVQGKLAHIDENGICPGCKKAGGECACENCTCKAASVQKVAYVAHVPGHKNSKGEAAPWVIKQHNTGKILESFKSEAAAKAGLKNMESHKASDEGGAWSISGVTPNHETTDDVNKALKRMKADGKKGCAPHETPFTNVGPGTSAHAEQEASAPAMKESVQGDEGKADEKSGSPIGIAIDETGVPRSKTEEAEGKSKAAADPRNPSNRKRETSHPETLRVSPDRMSSTVSAVFNGGFVRKDWVPDKMAEALQKDFADNKTYAPHAAADHEKDIKAGAYGDDPLNRRSNEKWGSAKVEVFKRSNKEIMADYVAEVVATETDEPSEAISSKSAAARAKKESLLDRFRPKTAVELDIDSIWDAITEDMGPAPLVDVETPGDTNPAPSNTEQHEGFDETPEAPKGRPNKKDVQDLPEAFRSTEPEDAKEISDSEAEHQETDLENDATKGEERHGAFPHESSWNSRYADFVEEVAGDIENEEELPRMGCDQCQMMNINGVPCHEQGCPNMGARWDAENGMWVPQRECFECGMEVDEDDPCCSRPVMDEAEEARWASAEKKADTADNGYDIDSAANPTEKETGPSDTVECHEDYNTERSEGTDRPKPGAGADIKQAGAEKRRHVDEMIRREKEGLCVDCGKAECECDKSETKTSGDDRARLLQSIQHGDSVTIMVPAGMGRGGQEWKEATGKAVMHSAEGGWVLNMGGPHGTPGLANERNIVRVRKAKKQADTADNPANWKGGEGIIQPKTDAEIKDTTGPDAPPPGQKASACSHQPHDEDTMQTTCERCGKELYYNSSSDRWTTSNKGKKADGIEGDAAEAKAETVSPDTVDADIQQPTVSVDDAAHKSGAEKVALHFMNTYDIDEAVNILGNDPVLGKAARFLKEFKDQVDSHSDGWAYWRAPVAAANQLMTLIEAGVNKRRGFNRHGEPEIEISDKAIAKAMGPIKAFMTRRGNAAGMVMPKLELPGGAQRRKEILETHGMELDPASEDTTPKWGADVSGDMSEAKSEVDYNKADMADEPKATDTVNPDHFAAKGDHPDDEKCSCKAYAYNGGWCKHVPKKAAIGERHDDVPVSQGDIPSEKQPKSDLSGVQPEAHDVPPQVDSKTACGESQPESIEFDFGAGDLADIVMVEDEEKQ
jgi:hypothetical protein